MIAASFFFLGGIPVPLRLLRPSRTCQQARANGRADDRQILDTWLNDSSTGVSRPKIDTRTFSFWPSALTSLIVAGSVANGPSMTVTDSPTSKSTSTTGPLAGVAAVPLPAVAGLASSTCGRRNLSTSSMVSGDGLDVAPTNPVTPGVLRTADQDASLRSIRTRM